MGQAVELYKKHEDGTIEACGIFYCSECRVVHRTQDEANWCHGERRCACGNKIMQGYYQRQCSDCDHKEWKEKERQKELKRFDEATKIAYADYKGEWVYDNDKFYPELEDAIDGYLEGHEPEYVWACKRVGIPRIDLEDVTTNILNNMWEEAETGDLNGIEELEKALQAFNDANKDLPVYEVDYSTAILVEKTVLTPRP